MYYPKKQAEIFAGNGYLHSCSHNISLMIELSKERRRGEFLGDPVVRTWHFHCPGPGFNSWLGELRSYKPGKKKKKRLVFLFYI